MNTVGTYVEPGLPNITGSVGFAGFGSYNSSAQSGALKNTSLSYSTTSTHSSSSASIYGIQLDASQSDSIYGSSSTVQPPAIQMYLEFYCN